MWWKFNNWRGNAQRERLITSLDSRWKKVFVVVEQGSRKKSNIVPVIVKSKAKEAAMKRMSTACGKEVIVKDKVENLTTFAPHDLTAKTEFTEDVESFLAQAM